MPGIRHLLLRLEGTLGTTQTWSVNPKFSFPPNGVPTQDSLDAWVAAIAAKQPGAIMPLRAYLSSAGLVTGVSAYYINDDGKAVALSKRSFGSGFPGTGSVVLPSQCSVVTTLQTNTPGRSTRGRLYWPLIAAQLDSTTMRLSSSDTANIANAVASWLQAMADAYGTATPILPVVNSGTAGTNTPVESIRVGDVVDTQRRRRDQFLEAYSSVPMP